MTTTYRLNVNELSIELINSIKAAFKDKEIEIVVSEPIDETDYLLASPANADHLNMSMKDIADNKGIEMSIDDFRKNFTI